MADADDIKDDSSVNVTDQSRKKKEKKRPRKRSSKKTSPKTKVVVRRLPPNIPAEIFNNSVKNWVNDSTVDWQLFVPGKLSSSKAKQNVFSRAYFHFLNMEAVLAFHQGYDGHLFIDGKGNEYRAVVEFSPFQKIPKEHKPADPRQGTIESDPDYIAFVESLSVADAPLPNVNDAKDGLSNVERLENRISMLTAQNHQAEQANKPKTTPLLDHLRAQKAAQAAAKSKAQAAKAAAKQAKAQAVEGKSTKKVADEPSKKASKREKERRKREEKKAAAAAAATGVAGATGSQPSSSKTPVSGKADGEKPAKKEGKAKINQQGVQQIVKILGRQPDKDAKTTDSPKPASQPQPNQVPKQPKPSGENDSSDVPAGMTRKEKERLRQQRREQERQQRREKEAAEQPAKEPAPTSQSTRGGGGRGSRGGRGYLGNRGGMRGGGRGN